MYVKRLAKNFISVINIDLILCGPRIIIDPVPIQTLKVKTGADV